MGSQRLSTMVKGQSSFPLVAPLSKFAQRGQSGGVGFPENLDRNIASVYGELFVPEEWFGAALVQRRKALGIPAERRLETQIQ